MPEARKPTTVEEYIAMTRDFAWPICERLLALIRETAPHLRESIKWGSPKFEGKRLICGIGAFSKHVSLYFMESEKMTDPQGLMRSGDGEEGGGTIKFSSVDEIPEAAIVDLLRQAVTIDEQDIKRTRARREVLPVPPVLESAFAQHLQAKTHFEKLPPSQQREYCEWIAGAKQEATVRRRVAKAMDLLNQGRGLNDQYR